MRFEAREVEDYAEPVASSDLRKGESYFMLQFMDDTMLVPIMTPFVFVGTHSWESGDERYILQEYDSYAAGERFDPGGESLVAFQLYRANEMNHIFEFEKALNVLLRCSIRRRDTR
jgi:hypothetical protein